LGRYRKETGYTLIELILVLIIIGIIATVALNSLRSSTSAARVEKTKRLLERITFAIAGNPTLVSGGGRTDYGYVGDVGSLPPNLDALAQNPGGYSTWRGPYIRDEFTSGGTSATYESDAWGNALVYGGGTTVSSTGGGSAITRTFADSVGALLRNRVTAVITDLARGVPGDTYDDSVQVLLSVPNGIGGTTTKSRHPNTTGYVRFDSIPVGLHDLRVVYAPTHDTIYRKTRVDPGQDTYTEISLSEKVW
jgi:prepilin-type N-terminal cleavage/methylation domain-containing protein